MKQIPLSLARWITHKATPFYKLQIEDIINKTQQLTS